MSEKTDLLAAAQKLGIRNLSMRNTIPQLQDAIARRQARVGGKRFSAAELEPLTSRLFGVPRSVFVGARSAGLIPDSVTKAEAEEGLRKFMEKESS